MEPLQPSRETNTSDPWEHSLLQDAGWVRRVAAQLLGRDGADADDLSQSVLAVALERRPPLHVGRSGGLRRWLLVVTRRLAVRQRIQDARAPASLEAASPPAGGKGPADAVARLEEQKWLADQVLALPEPYRTAIVDRFLNGRSVGRIATAQGVTPAAVRKQLSRGIAMLRARVDQDSSGQGRVRALALVAVPVAPAATASAPQTTGSTASAAALALPTAVMMKTALTVVAAVVVVGSLLWLDWNQTRPATTNPPLDRAGVLAESGPSEAEQTAAVQVPPSRQAAAAVLQGEMPEPPPPELLRWVAQNFPWLTGEQLEQLATEGTHDLDDQNREVALAYVTDLTSDLYRVDRAEAEIQRTGEPGTELLLEKAAAERDLQWTIGVRDALQSRHYIAVPSRPEDYGLEEGLNDAGDCYVRCLTLAFPTMNRFLIIPMTLASHPHFHRAYAHQRALREADRQERIDRFNSLPDVERQSLVQRYDAWRSSGESDNQARIAQWKRTFPPGTSIDRRTLTLHRLRTR